LRICNHICWGKYKQG